MESLVRKPSGWVPMVLSLGILLMELGFVLLGPPEPQADESVGAHLFQLWLVAEFFLVLFFALKWVPRKPKAALKILAIQSLGVLAGMFPVFYFHW